MVALALVAACLAGPPSDARASPKPAKVPALSGLWSFNSTTRLERPSVYPSLVISEAQEKAIKAPPVFPDDDVGQEASEWQDDGWRLARIAGQIRTSWLVDPPDGRLPYTEAGQKLVDQPRQSDNPEGRTTNERCLAFMSAGPPMLNGGGNNNLQLMQAPGYVVILLEAGDDLRIIPIASRRPQALPKEPPVWLGHSLGWYEGDTLVVATTGFHPQQSKRRSNFARLYLSPDAVVTERFRRLSPTQVLYDFEVHDPSVFRRDWRGELPLNALKGPIFETACHEGNYSLTGILAGARREDAERARAAAHVSAQAP